jgi:phosphopantothenoylcysteine decarboxylase / phosphopantothenate---cysteine ligase
MLKNKILIKITGSIAAYKVGYLISKLVQNGFEVKTVVTESALKFLGIATLEGLTNNPVYSDTFESGKMMSHINLTKWADLTILVPADANTINKFSGGIADNLVTSLFLAHDNSKPYLIAPAMNVAMYEHPATQASLDKLTNWGITVLPTEEGYLACGDEGKGKLINPDKIYSYIVNSLRNQNNSKRILITSGGTKEKVDNIRYMTNLSTGKTGASLADYFFLQGYNVTLIKSNDSAMPEFDVNILEFDDFDSISHLLQNEIKEKQYDGVIHLAAISDYSPKMISTGKQTISLPTEEKISSSYDSVTVTLERNRKIINLIKDWSVNKQMKLIGFKFVNSHDLIEGDRIIDELFSNSNADCIVYNAFDKRVNNEQTTFEIIQKNKKRTTASDAKNLGEVLNKIIMEDK